MNKILSKLSIFTLILFYLIPVMPVKAVGLDIDFWIREGSTSPVTPEIDWYLPSGTRSYTTGTTITIVVEPPMLNLTSDSTYIDTDNSGAVDSQYTTSSCGPTNCSITFTVVKTTDNVGSYMATSVVFTFDSTPRNYSVSVLTSSPVDFGSALWYANGGNQVNVTASVPSSLSFSIRDSADTGDTNSCALGILSTAAVSTCSYRLRIATNALNGFSVDIGANHSLGTGTATMTNIGDNAAFAAGTESYGISVLTGATTGGRSGASVYDQPVVEENTVGYTYQTDSSPLPQTRGGTVNFISYAAPFQTQASPSLNTTTLVTHAAAISTGTPPGSYSQIVYYDLTASF